MKKTASLYWGIAFIILSLAFLADRLGYIDFEKISDNNWVYIFAAAAVLFLMGYLINGVKQWGWLFPTFIFTALALTIWMASRDLEGSFFGAPILAAVALPFFIGFAFNRRSWGLLIPAWIMTILTIVTLTADRLDGTLIGALFLISAALPFLVVFLANRAHRWALIPAWVLFILGLITLLSEHISGNLIGALFMYSVALPFLVVYLQNRSQRWALIPAAVTALVGTFPLIGLVTGGDLMGAIVMFLFSLPFFIIYFRWKENWWALIPAGIFASLGLVVVISLFRPHTLDGWDSLLTGILFLGFGLTFGLLWLRCATLPTDWARYPAIGLLVASLLAFILGRNFQDYWAVGLLVVGILLIVTSLLPRKSRDQIKPVDPS